MNAWLRLTNSGALVVFDCEHNGVTWLFDWVAGENSGSCETVEQLCEVAAQVRVANPNAIAEGFFLPEFELYMNIEVIE